MIRLIVALTILLVGGPTRAGDRPPNVNAADARAAFEQSDTNHDGAIDHEEYQERITEVFFFADKNKDGWLEPDELDVLVFADDFKADDKDKDGRVSLREFMRVRFRDFTKADTNDDGVLELDEVVATYDGKHK
jgi:Ca2+-binding EF-hand superfamily protein